MTITGKQFKAVVFVKKQNEIQQQMIDELNGQVNRESKLRSICEDNNAELQYSNKQLRAAFELEKNKPSKVIIESKTNWLYVGGAVGVAVTITYFITKAIFKK